jgi:hypothetical protein
LCYNGTRLRYREAKIFKCLGNFILGNKILYSNNAAPPHSPPTSMPVLNIEFLPKLYILYIHFPSTFLYINENFKRVVPVEGQFQEIFDFSFFHESSSPRAPD